MAFIRSLIQLIADISFNAQRRIKGNAPHLSNLVRTLPADSVYLIHHDVGICLDGIDHTVYITLKALYEGCNQRSGQLVLGQSYICSHLREIVMEYGIHSLGRSGAHAFHCQQLLSIRVQQHCVGII